MRSRRPSSNFSPRGRRPSPPPPTLGLKRDPSLIPLSRDHHAALVQAQALKRAADGIPPQERPQAPESVARSFMGFYTAELVPHMAEEEEILLPRAESADPEGAEQLRSEHARIRTLAASLDGALLLGEIPRLLLKELGTLLEEHVRFEERDFFVAVQAMLKPEALKALGRALLDKRSLRGSGQGCAVPRRELS